MVQWFRLMAHNQEVVGSNPGTIYWMAVNNASYFIKGKNNEYKKVAEWGGAHKFFFF
jgi:hypothetical protein